MRFTTYNLLDLFGSDSAGARRHYEMVVEVIRSVDPDVLAVQEVLAPDGPTAADRLRALALDAGLRCEVPGAAGRQAALLVAGRDDYLQPRHAWPRQLMAIRPGNLSHRSLGGVSRRRRPAG